jgi:hypothetical protein
MHDVEPLPRVTRLPSASLQKAHTASTRACFGGILWLLLTFTLSFTSHLLKIIVPMGTQHLLDLSVSFEGNSQQSMLIAPNSSVLLLCVCPAFEQLAHGEHNPAVRAIALH